MVNSQELNKTISELETQVQKFKSISDVYAELITLKSDLIKFGEALLRKYPGCLPTSILF